MYFEILSSIPVISITLRFIVYLNVLKVNHCFFGVILEPYYISVPSLRISKHENYKSVDILFRPKRIELLSGIQRRSQVKSYYFWFQNFTTYLFIFICLDLYLKNETKSQLFCLESY